MDTILIATQEPRTNAAIRSILSGGGRCAIADQPDRIRQQVKTIACDCLFIDLPLMEALSGGPDRAVDPKAGIQHLKDMRPTMAIVMVVGKGDVRNAVRYVKNGASNYITAPVDADELHLVIDEISRERHRQSELAYLRERIWKDDSLDIVQTLSPKMKKVYHNVLSVSPTKTTVLLLGETGTGKTFTAKLIHRHSNRKDGPFISVHCGAIPDTLIESELFGHEKGAFTGAHRRKLGKFEVASGGTIFLDEIGTIAKSAQVKLLTVLQEGNYQRVGGEQTLKANVRVIAASNADLKQMCDEGLFRKDLYYRLNVFPITIPQVNERREDIPLFVNAFREKFNQFNAKDIQGVHPDVMHALMHYDWPGNIREIENLVERAHILETTSELTPESFPAELFDTVEPTTEVAIDTTQTLAAVRKKGLTEIERRYLKDVLSRNKGRINTSASEAGVSTRQLNKLMHKYGLDKGLFK
ncbi:Fis family transcriptional regulator [Desulfosarcina alkanivorans]|uniref:Fis family transcriptional regulator n=1 Tax=Desulfosarcina alkanivorans TaxID=571177 RepID=A0A5K7YPR4_9BACT|nr:sigma-54 dependent transcriptional regulator [Desulfosarcina alkanivorans]BBO70340.1 Fis family transcriptional regulator [Desulfosarcina alkanivorans]